MVPLNGKQDTSLCVSIVVYVGDAGACDVGVVHMLEQIPIGGTFATAPSSS